MAGAVVSRTVTVADASASAPSPSITWRVSGWLPRVNGSVGFAVTASSVPVPVLASKGENQLNLAMPGRGGVSVEPLPSVVTGVVTPVHSTAAGAAIAAVGAKLVTWPSSEKLTLAPLTANVPSR